MVAIMITALIVIGSIFLYLLFGYVFTTVLLSLGEDFCVSNVMFINTDEPDFSLFMGSLFWPFTIFLMTIIAFCKLIIVIGNKLSILPVTIALLIKYKIDKKEES